jgi:ribosomal protein S18 acetylase RimI-like enzyme
VIELVPFAEGPEVAAGLVPEAMRACSAGEWDPSDRIPGLTDAIRAGEAPGGLLRREGRPVGLALLGDASSLGVSVELLYLAPDAATRAGYEEALGAIVLRHGELAFAPGVWPGVSAAEVGAAMRARDFAPFARSEMRYPPERPIPPLPDVPGVSLRPMTTADRPSAVELHARAYRGRLDRFLFYRDPDDRRNAEILFEEVYAERWGPVIASATLVAERDGGLVGNCLVVSAPYGPLIADIAVEPAEHGRGIAGALLLASLHAIRATGATVTVLTVTEGNDRARRLYERIGFVLSAGPMTGYFSRRRVPVSEVG